MWIKRRVIPAAKCPFTQCPWYPQFDRENLKFFAHYSVGHLRILLLFPTNAVVTGCRGYDLCYRIQSYLTTNRSYGLPVLSCRSLVIVCNLTCFVIGFSIKYIVFYAIAFHESRWKYRCLFVELLMSDHGEMMFASGQLCETDDEKTPTAMNLKGEFGTTVITALTAPASPRKQWPISGSGDDSAPRAMTPAEVSSESCAEVFPQWFTELSPLLTVEAPRPSSGTMATEDELVAAEPSPRTSPFHDADSFTGKFLIPLFGFLLAWDVKLLSLIVVDWTAFTERTWLHANQNVSTPVNSLRWHQLYVRNNHILSVGLR